MCYLSDLYGDNIDIDNDGSLTFIEVDKGN